jgi:hypothetical protein
METTQTDIRNTAVTAIPDFNLALAAFVAATQEKILTNYGPSYPAALLPRLSVDRGRLNVKIVSTSGTSRSVFCFVRIADGAVLKADGWKKPAKHARGSIYINQGQDAVGPYGANYLR